jgi:23S rRNA pseudouridine1911/1915/1917 synthase
LVRNGIILIIFDFAKMNTIHLETQIPESTAGLRLDQALAKLFPEYSRARLQSWIKAGQVTVDGKIYYQRDKVHTGQKIVVNAQIEPQQAWEPQPISLNIIYEDKDIIVINKPAGLVVHPGAGNQKNTLVNALLHHVPELAEIPRAGIVHRLDKNTSGLLIIAKSLTTHHKLVKQIQQRIAKREYQAIVTGLLISGGTIEEPIGRHPIHRTKMAVVANGKEAVTHYRVIERFRAHTFLKVQLETGRTHQIRVHMAHIHHPIIGDPEYAGRLKLPAGISAELTHVLQNFNRQALHAWRLEIEHPRTGKMMHWEAPLPKDMQDLLDLLRKDL